MDILFGSFVVFKHSFSILLLEVQLPVFPARYIFDQYLYSTYQNDFMSWFDC